VGRLPAAGSAKTDGTAAIIIAVDAASIVTVAIVTAAIVIDVMQGAG